MHLKSWLERAVVRAPILSFALALVISTSSAAEPAPNATLVEREPASGDEPPTGRDEAETERFFKRWSKSTMGGIQLWDDELVFHDYRIQRHSLTGHCRLLDKKETRLTWGTYETCAAELEKIKRDKKLAPMTGRVVIVLHGLGGWRAKMDPLCGYLNKQGFQTVNVGYASTRGSLAQHAQSLAKVISHLDQVSEINFVGHSMGNLVIRHYLADNDDTSIGRIPDKRIKRFVMLAPPNHGAELATELGTYKLFELVLGDAAVELGPKWGEVERHLATPKCEFGIIAGGLGDQRGYNSHLDGDDDFVLTVATTRLDGASDFTVLPVLHPLTMNDRRVQEDTARFLKDGYFIAADQRHPLPEVK